MCPTHLHGVQVLNFQTLLATPQAEGSKEGLDSINLASEYRSICRSLLELWKLL